MDDHGKPVADYFLEFFSNPQRADDAANAYLHAHVLEDVKKNGQNAALRNLYFDRSDLVNGYYPRFAAGEKPVLYLSVYADPPGDHVRYFDPDQSGAQGMVQVHLEGDATKRWLKRNTTHFLQIILPRRPGDGVFGIIPYAS